MVVKIFKYLDSYETSVEKHEKWKEIKTYKHTDR